jgi:hypothetical protein
VRVMSKWRHNANSEHNFRTQPQAPSPEHGNAALPEVTERKHKDEIPDLGVATLTLEDGVWPGQWRAPQHDFEVSNGNAKPGCTTLGDTGWLIKSKYFQNIPTLVCTPCITTFCTRVRIRGEGAALDLIPGCCTKARK